MTEYTIIFEANGGVGNPPASVQYEEGATVTLPTEIELTKEGFVFGGWAESDDGKVPVDEPYLMPGKETTLYAIWNIIEKYTLSYDIQGGVGEVPAGGEYAEGQVVGLDDGTGLTKEGFEFGGWAETEGGDAIIGDFEMPGANTVLYAVWVEEDGDNGEGEGEEEGGQPEEMTFDEFIAECDRIIGLCRDLKDARDYDKGIQARQVVKETSQDKIMGLREDKVVKIRNYGFDL